MKKQITAALILVIAGGLGIGACSTSKPAPESSTAASQNPGSEGVTIADAGTRLDSVKIDNSNPKLPKITINKPPLKVDETMVKVLKEGTGKTLENTDIASFDFIMVRGNGKSVVNTFSLGTPFVRNMTSPMSPKGFLTSLSGKKVGTTYLFATPPLAELEQTNFSRLGVQKGESILFYVNIKQAWKPRESLSGTQTAVPSNLPQVQVDSQPGSQAKITMPPGVTAPSTLKTVVLIKGDGPKVVEGQAVKVSYTGAVWNTGKVFDSTAKHGTKSDTFQVMNGALITGFVKGLTGQTLGSRIMMIIPPADGYGSSGQPQAGIKGTDTLVFVVDLLGSS